MERRLVAIMSADVVGYMSVGPSATLATELVWASERSFGCLQTFRPWAWLAPGGPAPSRRRPTMNSPWSDFRD